MYNPSEISLSPSVHSYVPQQLRRPLGIIRWIGRPRPVGLAGGFGRWGKVEKDGDIPRVVYFNSGKIWKKMKKMENIRNMWKNMEKTWEEMGNMAIEVYFNGDLKYDLMGIRWKILGK